MGIAAEKYLTELFQLNRIPHVYDAKLSRIRKNFIGFVGAEGGPATSRDLDEPFIDGSDEQVINIYSNRYALFSNPFIERTWISIIRSVSRVIGRE